LNLGRGPLRIVPSAPLIRHLPPPKRFDSGIRLVTRAIAIGSSRADSAVESVRY
jgi:hypothetical protein